MKFVRFKSSGEKARFGILEDETVSELEGNIFKRYKHKGTRIKYKLSKIKLLPPCLPTKIVAVGLNYRDHAEELGRAIPKEPLLFLKPGTAVIGHEDKIIYPKHMSSRVDYEGELGIVIGKEARWVSEKDSLDYVFGYTCFNDVTARDLQTKDVQFTRAKGFDTFAPMGPAIVMGIEPDDLEVSSRLNGDLKQKSRTSQLIFSVPKLIRFISRVMTLLPGDVIAAGTPGGIGPMQVGDTIEVKVEGIGILRNYVT